jgi:hypothetical protein
MASYMLVRHKVRDFDTWKTGYDAHAPKRADSGLAEKYLLRSADDPNEVVILLEAGSLERARAFAESPDLRQKMQEAGVVDKPDIYFLNS